MASLKHLAPLALATSFLAVSPVAAAPVSYDESASGDLADDFLSGPLFYLDVGLNTVSGSTFKAFNGTEDDDGFRFNLADGLYIKSATFLWAVTLQGDVITANLIIDTHYYVPNSTSIVGAFETNVNLLVGDPVPVPSDILGSAGYYFLPGDPIPRSRIAQQTWGVDFGAHLLSGLPGSEQQESWSVTYTYSFDVGRLADIDSDGEGNSVPEPATGALVLAALAGLGAVRRRRRE